MVARPTLNRLEHWINKYESLYESEYEQLDMSKVKSLTDQIYSQMPRISRDEMYRLEKEFNEENPVNKMKVPDFDIEAKR